jgi:hypothetical protein
MLTPGRCAACSTACKWPGRVTDPPVMFQKITYDGLVGDRFLRNFTTTYDLAAARMIFALPG